MPNNITIMTYFKFLIHVCYRPFLKDEIKAKGITWNIPENYTRYMKGKLYYMTKMDSYTIIDYLNYVKLIVQKI